MIIIEHFRDVGIIAGQKSRKAVSCAVSTPGRARTEADRAWRGPRGRRGIRRAPRARVAPPRRDRPARRPARPGCDGSGDRRSPGRCCKTGRDDSATGSRRQLCSASADSPRLRCTTALRCQSSASSGSSESPSAHTRSAAAVSPSIWWHRAINANSFRVIESLGADRVRLRRRYFSAPTQSRRSMAIAPRLNSTNGSSGRSFNSSRRIRISQSSFRPRSARLT